MQVFFNLAHFIFSLGFILHLRFNKLSRFSTGSAQVQRSSSQVQMHPPDPVQCSPSVISAQTAVWFGKLVLPRKPRYWYQRGHGGAPGVLRFALRQ